MQVRDDFHKAIYRRSALISSLFVVLGAAAACRAGDAAPSGDVPAEAQAARAAGSVSSPSTAPPATTVPPAGHAWVIFGADTVLAEVASTAEERAEGLMYREEVPDGTGMLFVFQDTQIRSFWMANTYVALDVAYMDPAFRIVDIIAMEPLDTSSYPSQAPAMFALEVRQGWFAEQGIAIGDQADVVFGVRGR